MAVVTETIYIEGAETLEARLSRINTIIETLETRMVEAGAGQALTAQYSLNDGQVTISTTYRTPESIAQAIFWYEKLAEKLRNKLNGRVVALRDWRGLR